MTLQSTPAAVTAMSLVSSICCSNPPDPPVSVHYLGHSAFLLSFDNGPTVLTDYGHSRSYGLDSPVYELGSLVPDILTLSHDHDDHAGGELPNGVGRILMGDGGYDGDGLSVSAIRTYEGTLESPDNTSYLFEYRGTKILHLGDCQTLIVNHSDPEVRIRIAALYPDTYDVVFVPIGFVRDILAEAAEFVTLLDARRIVPMHYWSPPDRDSFLDSLDGRMDSRGRRYQVTAGESPVLTIHGDRGVTETVDVVGLAPAPFSPAGDIDSGHPQLTQTH